MRSGDTMRNAEPEAGAGSLVLDGRTPVEPFKNPSLFLVRYSVAIVGDLDRQPVIGSTCADHHWLLDGRIAIVNVLTGGKKKKLKTRVASTEDRAASRNPHAVAITKTSSGYANPTVVALTRTTVYATKVTIATAVKDINNRNARRPNVFHRLPPTIPGTSKAEQRHNLSSGEGVEKARVIRFSRFVALPSDL